MILMVGATGQLGGMITRRLLDEGESVRILVRPDSLYRPLVDAGAEPVIGDLKERASLDAACQGVEAVITTANSAMRGGEDTVEAVDLLGNRNLIEASKAAGVEQFIFTSALGVAEDSPVPLFQAKAKTEAYLRESELPFTILSPNFFLENWAGMVIGMPLQTRQPVTLVGEGRRQHSFVSVVDVVSFAAAAVNHPAAINQQIVIGGPEPVSWRDIIAAFEVVTGREIPVQSIAPGEPLPNLPPEVSMLLAALETYDSPIEMAKTTRVFEVELTPMPVAIQQMLAHGIG